MPEAPKQLPIPLASLTRRPPDPSCDAHAASPPHESSNPLKTAQWTGDGSCQGPLPARYCCNMCIKNNNSSKWIVIVLLRCDECTGSTCHGQVPVVTKLSFVLLHCDECTGSSCPEQVPIVTKIILYMDGVENCV